MRASRRAEQRVVDHGDVPDAAHGAFEQETLALGEASSPAALDLVGQRVEPARDVIRGGVGGGEVAGDFGLIDPGDRGLLDHLAVIAAVQIVQGAADGAGILHQRQQVAALAILARRQLEHAVVEAGLDQVIFQRALVLQVLLGLAARLPPL